LYDVRLGGAQIWFALGLDFKAGTPLSRVDILE
jgi:hypothetical protein